MDSLSQKQCSKCGEKKNLDQFHKNKSKKYGVSSFCKSCSSIYCKKWRKDNSSKLRINQKIWRENNKEKVIGYEKKWALNNPEKRKEFSRKWYRENAEKVAKYLKEWRRNNPEKRREQDKKWFAKNPSKSSEYHTRRRARERDAEGSFSAKDFDKLKTTYNYTCLRCHRKEPEIKLSADHVIPLSKGGSNSIDNIQPLCINCNKGKGVKHIDYR